MAEQPKCPTCHSKISTESNHREQGQDGVDENGDPIPRWTDDPLLTQRGFSGGAYIGRNDPRLVHIEELQTDRHKLEGDSGINPTEFSSLDEDQSHIRKLHIIQLRESIEKILDANGISLEDYFKLDENGTPVTPGPNDELKTDWTDVARGVPYLNKDGSFTSSFTLPSGEVKPSPSFPPGTRIRAIHIEDLRHAIQLGWREFWSISGGSTKMPADHAGYVETALLNTDNSTSKSYSGEATANRHTDGAVPNHPEFTDTLDETETDDVISPNYEENPPTGTFRAFPTSFDIHPTDAGNRYLYIPFFGGPELIAYPDGSTPVQPEKTWIIDGNCGSFAKEHVKHILYTPNPLVIGGVLVAQPTKLNLIETGTYIQGHSTTEANIIGLSVGNIAILKPTAKTLQLKVTGEVTVIPVITDGTQKTASASIAVSHIWDLEEGLDPFFGYPIPDDKKGAGNKGIGIRKDTHYKFHVVRSGTGTGGGDPFTNATTPTPTSAASAFMLLELSVGGTPRFFQMKFGPAGTGAQVYTAPFGGQSFTYSPVTGFALGLGPTYDEAINVNDFLAVASLPAIGNFPYTNHKMIDPDTNQVVENPAGSLVEFIWTRFILNGSATGVNPGVAQTGFGSDGKPIFDFSGVGGGPATVSVELKINALRIENNNRRVQDITT